MRASGGYDYRYLGAVPLLTGVGWVRLPVLWSVPFLRLGDQLCSEAHSLRPLTLHTSFASLAELVTLVPGARCASFTGCSGYSGPWREGGWLSGAGPGCAWVTHASPSPATPDRLLWSLMLGVPPSPDGPATLVHGTERTWVMGEGPIPVSGACVRGTLLSVACMHGGYHLWGPLLVLGSTHLLASPISTGALNRCGCFP